MSNKEGQWNVAIITTIAGISRSTLVFRSRTVPYSAGNDEIGSLSLSALIGGNIEIRLNMKLCFCNFFSAMIS